MGWVCRLFRKNRNKFVPVWKNAWDMSNADIKLFDDTQRYILEQSGKKVVYNGYLQTLADSRTLKQENLKLGRDPITGKGNLHWYFPGDAKPYVDAGCFIYTEELANKGIVNDLNSFKKSPDHNPQLISGMYDYIACSNRGEYCVILLARKPDKVKKLFP